MVGLNQDFKKVFVTTNNTLLASGSTTALAQCQLGLFDASTYDATNAPTWSSNPALLIAQGTPDNSFMPKGAGIKNETDKAKVVIGKKITAWRKKAYSAGQQQIITIGYDGVDTTKTISGSCDEIKHLYIKLTGKPIENLIPGGLVVHVEAQGPCCATCGDSCASVDGRIFANAWIDQLNQFTFLGLLNKYSQFGVNTTLSASYPLGNYISYSLLYDAGTGATGIRFTGAFVEATTSTCYFDRFPYNSDPVHIQLSEYNPDWHGSRCQSTYPVTHLQEVTYPFGAGEYVMRYEAQAHGWDMRDYNKFDVFLRQAENQYLCTDPAVNYDKYTLTYEVSYHVLGWSDVYTDRYDLEVFVSTTQTAYKNAINSWISGITGSGIPSV